MRRNFLRGLIICLVPTLLAAGFIGWALYEESPAAQQEAATRSVAREQAMKDLSAAVAVLAPLQQEDDATRARGEKPTPEQEEKLKQAVAAEKAAREAAAPDGWKPQFRRGIDLAGGTSLIYQVKSGDLEEKDIKELADKLKMRIDENDLKNVVVRPVDRNKVEIILPFVGGAGGKEKANEEFVEDVQQKVKQTGVLEFRTMNLRFDYRYDAFGDTVLKFENFIQFTVEILRPQLCSAPGIHQARGNPQPTCRLPDTAFKRVAHTQFCCHLPHIHGFALVGEGGVAGDDGETLEAAQSRDDVFDNTIGEIVLFRIAAQILEGQHGK